MKKICVAGLNPAWQKTLIFEDFKRGGINRAAEFETIPSGKGINFARAVKTWGTADPTVYQFLGGDTGKCIRRGLWNEAISNISVEIPGETRTCVTAVSLSDATSTELIEPSARVPSDAAMQLLEALCAGLNTSDALAICGTCPPGLNEYFYGKTVRHARENGKFILLDTVQYIETALEEGVDLVKINREELAKLSGENDLNAGYQTFFERYRIQYLAVTDGPDAAWFQERGKALHRIAVPFLSKEELINPIGSGDTCSGVTLACILDGMPVLEAFRTGLAAASANCLSKEPAVFEKETALALLDRCIVQPYA